MKNKQKTIGIDARFYGPLGKGLGRYTQEIVDNILKIDTQNKYVIFLYKENFDEFKTDNPNVKKVEVDIRWYTLAEQILFPYIIRREKIDLMHFHHFNVPLFCPTNFVVTIHDLILTKFPTVRASTLSPWIYKLKNLAYKFIISRAIKGAKKIIAVSEFTKRDIVEQFKISSDKIEVIYEGVSDKIKKIGTASELKSDVLTKYSIKKPYLLYVGNAYPHKNLEMLIEIFPELSKVKKNLQLVLVGKEDYFYKRLKTLAKKNESQENIIFPGFVPDVDLKMFYKEALLYVFPSKYEGFGLPPIEAIVNGCAVASSDQASMPEILGGGAIFFDPYNKETMISILQNAIKDENLRLNKLRIGQNFVVRYDWKKSAKDTLNVLNNFL